MPANVQRHLAGVPETQTNPINVTIWSGREGRLPDIKAKWEQCRQLAPEHQQLFGYEWIDGWVRYLGNSDGWTGETRVLLASDPQGRCVGVIPLAKRRFHGMTFWALAGYYQPVRGFLCIEERQAETCEALAQALLRMQRWGETLRFGPIDREYPERRMLMQALGSRLVSFEREPTIIADDVPQSPGEYEAMVRSHSSMKRVRSYERRMEREGEALIVHHRNPRDVELRAMLTDCSTIEKKSWLAKSASGFPRFDTAASLKFWEHVCANQLGPLAQLDVWVAYFNATPIAFRFAITTGSIRYMIANQYDESFAQYRAGWILYLRDLQDCAERGVRSIDMGNGNLEYKSRWGGKAATMHHEILVLPPGPAGLVGKRLLSLKPLYRRARPLVVR
jgi:hypothetical protein